MTGTYLLALADAARPVVCAVAGAGQDARDWVVERVAAATGMPLLDAAAPLTRGVLATFCPDDPTHEYVGPVPFSGGQCETVYDITYAWEFRFRNNLGFEFDQRIPTSGTDTGFATGPLGAPFIRTQGNAIVFGVPTSGGASEKILSSSTFSTAWTLLSSNVITFDVTRQDGQPDDCGNPEPEGLTPKPPEASTGPTSVTYLDNNGTSVNVTIPFVDIEGFGVDINGNLNINFNLGGIRLQLGGNGEPKFNTQPNNLDPEDESPDTRAVLLGVFYTVTQEPIWANYNYVEGGKYYFPRCGSIRFEGNGKASEELQLNGESGYIENPNRDEFHTYVTTSYSGAFTIEFQPDRRRIPIIERLLLSD